MKMTHRLIALTLLLASAGAHAELVVVANPSAGVSSLTQAQLSRLFLGQAKSYPNGNSAQPLDASGNERNTFYADVLKRSPDQMSKYWARMIFAGQATPPRQVSPQEMKSLIAQTPGAIGYLDSSQVDGSVKVISVTP